MSKTDSLLHTKTDSILYMNKSQQENSSIFLGHTLKSIHQTPIYNIRTPSYWQGILLFSIFTVYVLIRISQPKKIIKIFISVFSLQEAKQLFREEFKLTKRITLLLGISFILVIAFLVQFTNQYFGLILNGETYFNQYVFFVGIISLMYVIKFISNYILAYISSNNELGKEYIFNVFVFSQAIGIIIFPLIVCLQFSKFPTEWFLYPALIVSIGFYTLRMIRGFVISSTEQSIGFLYIFLYLCALEILPSLVLVKFLLVNF